MYEAKHELVRILLKSKRRENLLNQLDEELNTINSNVAKSYYFTLLKISCRIFNQISQLRNDNPMLNRPFIYQGKNM